MYRTMLDLHREQQAAKSEQVEIDKAYKAVRAMRMKQTFHQYFAQEEKLQKWWRADRTRR
jgi:hypothetical protein